MTKPKTDAYRQELLGLRARLSGDVSHLTNEALRKSQQDASGSASSMPIHMADLGTDNFEQEFTLNLLANEEQVLDEIAAALERIEEGKFGRCEECQKEIPKVRLDALPYARNCVACARRLERSP